MRRRAILPVRIHSGGSMNKVATTRMSSKGQVVIPEAVRDRLGLRAGSEFVVLGDGDVVILKAIKAPELSEFDALIAEAQSAAKAAGMPRSAVSKAVKEVRAGK
jgi:AbrB family looped-hinge helix DNA binding protein